MKQPLQIGITGGIGSGKSLVSKIFQTLGVPVYDADTRAKDLMMTDTVLIDDIRKEFGPEAYLSDGQINREYMARMVFRNPDQLQKLNRMTHPRVRENYTQWVNSMNSKPYVIKEAALIFEAGSSSDLDATIVVSAPVPMRLTRVMKRDPQRSRKDVEDIFNNQMPEEEKIKLADFVIINDETQLVIPQVLKLHDHFVNKS